MGEANHARNIESPKYRDTKYRGTTVVTFFVKLLVYRLGWIPVRTSLI